MQNRNKLLLAGGAAVIAAAGIGIGFASFNATTGSTGNSVSAGTIVLSQTNPTGTTCISTSGPTDTNTSSNCDAYAGFNIAKPGDSDSANFTLKNTGSLNAGTFRVFANGCTPGNTASASYSGGGNLCSQLQMTITEFTDSSFTAAKACVYGNGGANNGCAFDSGHTVATFASATGGTSGQKGVDIANGLTAGANRYFKVNLSLPSSTDNSFQGRSAAFDLNWFIQQ